MKKGDNLRETVNREDLLKKIDEYLLGEVPEKILDVGGTQETYEFLNQRFPSSKIYSLNINKSELPKTKNVFLASAEKMPFKDNYFDLLFVRETLEHIFRPDKFIKEAKRILKDGGKILVTTPNLNSWHIRLLILFGYAPTNYTPYPGKTFGIPKKFKTRPLYDHVRVFPYRALEEIFNSDGFKIVKMSGVMTYSENTWLWKWRRLLGKILPNRWKEGIVLKAIVIKK